MIPKFPLFALFHSHGSEKVPYLPCFISSYHRGSKTVFTQFRLYSKNLNASLFSNAQGVEQKLLQIGFFENV